MRLFPIDWAVAQYVTCPCGRVLYVVNGAAVCECCQVKHTVTVKTTRFDEVAAEGK
jgi:hypothetical protein